MIVFSGLDKRFADKIVFNGISAALNPAFRTGLVGPNGAGKTLLMRTITGEALPDSGSVVVPANLRLAYLAQEMDVDVLQSPLNYVLEPFGHLFDIESTTEHLSNAHEGSQDMYRRAAAAFDRHLDESAVHGVHSLPSRARSLLAGLGVPAGNWEQPMTMLSGGYRMRVALARLLLQDPDYLLLDEPTNHLDFDSLVWLERFLQRFRGGMLVVSHDRDFLKRTTNRTAELNHGSLLLFDGAIDAFLEWKEEHEQTEERRLRNLQARIDHAESFVNRFKAKATKASMARSRMKLVEKLKEELPDQPRVSGIQPRFGFPAPAQTGAVPLKLTDVAAAYGEAPVFSGLSLTVTRGDKIAVIGPNGAGKSTLLKTCAGLLTPAHGRVDKGHNTDIRYFSQHRMDQLEPGRTLYETIGAVSGSTSQNFIQSVLGAFLFSGDEVYKRVSVLSGGEKSRLSLACILARPGNVLLLDEPTNHLDIQSVERLADTLAAFEGTLLIVSHDEYFLSRACNRIFEMRPGAFRDFPGTLDDYRAYLEAGYLTPLDEASGQPPGAGEPVSAKEDRIRRREERKRTERRIEKLEKEIAALEQERESLKAALCNPENARDFQTLTQADRELGHVSGRLESLMTEWEQRQEELLSLDAQVTPH